VDSTGKSPADQTRQQIRVVFESYGQKERYALAYYYLLGWEPGEIGNLLHVHESAVWTQLELSRREFFDALGSSFEANPPLPIGVSEEQIRAQQHAHIDAYLASVFQAQWPAPEPTSKDWDSILAQVKGYDASKLLRWQWFARHRMLMLALVAIMAFVLLGWGASLLVSEAVLPGLAIVSNPGQTPEQTGLAEEGIFTTVTGPQAYLYRVQPGDSLEKIASELNLPLEKLSEQNQIDPYALLLPGQELVVVPGVMVNPPQPTLPVPPEAERLRQNNDSATITQRMGTSNSQWQTLWVDAQTLDYGPAGYIGAPRLYHAQTWVEKPAQSLELFGLVGENPSSVQLIREGTRYQLSPEHELPEISAWDESRESLLQNERLRRMVFPQTAPWLNQEGHFESVDQEKVAGREAIVVDWFNQAGQRPARLWLDAITGVVLRQQEFGGPGFETLVADTIVSEILYDLEIPRDTLFDPHLISYQGYAMLSNEQASSGDAEEPAFLVSPETRPRLPLDPAPPNFDPAPGWLHFQFGDPPQQQEALGSSDTEPAELFADGYFLDLIDIFPPWGLRCTRSPDGERLAFTLAGDGVVPPDSTLRWLNLQAPGDIYEPLPGFQAEYFTFAPDNRHLAVFGYDPQDSFRGVKIVDIGTGESRSLMPMFRVDSLIWSPDGTHLALVGQKEGSPQSAIMIVHVRLGELIFERPVELTGGTQEFSWSSMAWGLEFPLPMGGMEACAQPPGP
jgi:LysM repeat protein